LDGLSEFLSITLDLDFLLGNKNKSSYVMVYSAAAAAISFILFSF
jgi:hypothetical protein